MGLWAWSRGGLGSSTASGELDELKLSDSPSDVPTVCEGKNSKLARVLVISSKLARVLVGFFVI